MCIRKVTAKSLSRNGIAKGASFVFIAKEPRGGIQTRTRSRRRRRRRRQTQPLALSAREQIKRKRKERRIMRESAREEHTSTRSPALSLARSRSRGHSHSRSLLRCILISASERERERGRARENVRHKIIDSYHGDFRIVVVASDFCCASSNDFHFIWAWPGGARGEGGCYLNAPTGLVLNSN